MRTFALPMDDKSILGKQPYVLSKLSDIFAKFIRIKMEIVNSISYSYNLCSKVGQLPGPAILVPLNVGLVPVSTRPLEGDTDNVTNFFVEQFVLRFL